MCKEKSCYSCDCYDEDFGCTMPSIDKSYACPLEADEETLRMEYEKELKEREINE